MIVFLEVERLAESLNLIVNLRQLKMKREEILQILKDFKEKNNERYGILKLGIFGSVARNTNSQGSDIDIVMKISKVDLFMFVHLKEELEDLFNTNIDIVRYRQRMNHYLKKHIDKEAIYV